jgi:micrococcal nuclease
MKKLIIIIVGSLIIFSGEISAAPKEYGDINNVVYVRNYDGDTITFNVPNFHPVIGHNIPIRVNGIDTPEMRGKCKEEKTLAIKAKELVKTALMNAEKINLKNIKRGKYFRIVADVEFRGRFGFFNIKDLLIKSNLAVQYDGDTKIKDWCK